MVENRRVDITRRIRLVRGKGQDAARNMSKWPFAAAGCVGLVLVVYLVFMFLLGAIFGEVMGASGAAASVPGSPSRWRRWQRSPPLGTRSSCAAFTTCLM